MTWELRDEGRSEAESRRTGVVSRGDSLREGLKAGEIPACSKTTGRQEWPESKERGQEGARQGWEEGRRLPVCRIPFSALPCIISANASYPHFTDEKNVTQSKG